MLDFVADDDAEDCSGDECKGVRKRKKWCIREDDSAKPRPSGRCWRNVIPLVLAILSQTMKQQTGCYPGKDGASGRIRTSDRSVRSRVLYPAELRMHRETYFTADTDTAQKRYQVRDGASGRMTRRSLALRAVAGATLSPWCLRCSRRP